MSKQALKLNDYLVNKREFRASKQAVAYSMHTVKIY